MKKVSNKPIIGLITAVLLVSSYSAVAASRDEVCGGSKRHANAALKAKQIIQDKTEEKANKKINPLESCLDGILNGAMLPDFGFNYDLGGILDSVLDQACSAVTDAVNEPIDTVNGELGSWGVAGDIAVGDETVSVFGTQISGGQVGTVNNGYNDQFGDYSSSYQNNDILNIKKNFRNRKGAK